MWCKVSSLLPLWDLADACIRPVFMVYYFRWHFRRNFQVPNGVITRLRKSHLRLPPFILKIQCFHNCIKCFLRGHRKWIWNKMIKKWKVDRMLQKMHSLRYKPTLLNTIPYNWKINIPEALNDCDINPKLLKKHIW